MFGWESLIGRKLLTAFRANQITARGTELEKGLEAVINPRSGTIELHSLALLRIHDEHR